MKDRDFIWWATEIIGLILIFAVVFFLIYINASLSQNSSVTMEQKITNIAGIIFTCYGWSHMADKIVWKLRKLFRKSR